MCTQNSRFGVRLLHVIFQSPGLCQSSLINHHNLPWNDKPSNPKFSRLTVKWWKFGTWLMIFKATHLQVGPVPVRLLFGPPNFSKNAGATLLLGELCRCLGPRKVSGWDLFVGFAMVCNHQKDGGKLGTWKILEGNMREMYGRNTCLSFLPLYLMGEPMVFQSSIIIFGSLGLCLVYFSPKWCEPTCLMEGFDLSNQWNLYFTPKKKTLKCEFDQEISGLIEPRNVRIYTDIISNIYMIIYACMCVFIYLLIN